MVSKFAEVIEESVRLERKVEDIYNEYARRFLEDVDFWTQMAYEEHCHAELIKKKVDLLEEGKPFPQEMLCQKLDELKASNAFADEVYIAARSGGLSEEKALGLAMVLERCSGEMHLNKFSCRYNENPLALFNVLFKIDCEHAERVRKLIKSKGLDPAELTARVVRPLAS